MARDHPRYRRYRGGSSGASRRTPDPVDELRDLRRSERSGESGGAPRGGARGDARQPGRDPDERRTPVAPAGPRSRAAGTAARDPHAGERVRHGGRPRPLRRRGGRPIGRRVLRWVVRWAFAWVVLSLAVFLVSAQLHQADVGPGGDELLGGGRTPPVGRSTVLVIGSDRRPSDSREPGARTSGYGLADSIMLLRVGGGKQAKLSIARDTLVPIPDHGVGKINSAYAYGGPSLLVRTVEGYTGVQVNHVMQISFGDFPGLIDAMGGITYKGSCVISKVNGGYANGGVTLRIRSGERVHLNGRQALALARTRKNACNGAENDLSRARRQQKVLAAMKRRALSPIGFVRLPLIAWQAPKTMDSDMAGPRLLATMAGMALSTGGRTQVLGTETGVVPDELKQRRVDRFLGG